MNVIETTPDLHQMTRQTNEA